MKTIKRKNGIYLAAALAAAAGAVAMAVFPSMALESARSGVALWADTVLPALLPFFICANFMIALGVPQAMGRVFERPFQILFGAPGSSAFVFFISVTSGYPMGPKLIGDMGRRGELRLSDAKTMLSFCSTSGPLFMLGAVGVGMLGSPAAGAAIAVSHYGGAILNGILWRGLGRKEDLPSRQRQRPSEAVRPPQSGSLLDDFTQSILSALKSVGIICCYLILFTMISDFIQYTGVLRGVESPLIQAGVKGLLEMTVGCNEAAHCLAQNLLPVTVLCSFLISFGGFSIMAQSMSMLSGLSIGPLYYLQVKFTHGVLAAAIALITGHFFLGLSAQPVGMFASPAEAMTEPGFIAQVLFSTGMMAAVAVLFIFTILLDRMMKRAGRGRRRRKRKREQETA